VLSGAFTVAFCADARTNPRALGQNTTRHPSGVVLLYAVSEAELVRGILRQGMVLFSIFEKTLSAPLIPTAVTAK
jgi:hypothetical protein